MFSCVSEQLAESLQKTRKENASLKKRTDETSAAMVQYVAQNAKLTNDLATVTQQKAKLEALCRALQKRTSTENKQETATPESS